TLEIFDKNGKNDKKFYENDTIKTLENFHKAILNNDDNLCDLKQAFKVLKLCDKVKNG
ncbi:gfo/Idh/MocA family oxidoreductase, partial [Campylobacter lari]|nr:gfo/Idh/MocA family oxidoreductase [Campylobacter lari]